MSSRYGYKVRAAAAAASVLLSAGAVNAQVLGVFRWQLSPYCNVLSLTVRQEGAGFVLTGTDLRCGAAVQAAVTGTAFVNPNGSVGMGLVLLTPGTAFPTHIAVSISLTTLSGTWQEAGGNGGAFTYNPTIPTAGSPLPLSQLRSPTPYLQVFGAANESIYIGGDGAGSDVQIGSFNPAITNVATWNSATSTRMNFFAARIIATAGFNGTCRTDGVVAAGPVCNQDLAESFASVEPTKPGELVALVPRSSTSPAVRLASSARDDVIVGVVSQNPGLLFDNGETHLAGDNTGRITADRTVVAIAGRVMINVAVAAGSIAAGDALTSGAVPGVAVKATKVGQIVGYALEARDTDGAILVWLQPGYFVPTHVLDRLNNLPTLETTRPDPRAIRQR